MRGRWKAGPLGLAVILTLINAIKPVLIDDTAYILFARHLAQQPLDPYNFTLHWYTLPDRGMDVLLPPVLPYWLALGITLFGEHIVLLKLWLFPILWCFTHSLSVLLRRFAKGTERLALPLIVLSPAILPTVNLMLDIPAAALGLAAVALFASRRSQSVARVIASGIVAGLAMQTKYTAMLAPAAILWYGFTHGRTRTAILACGVATATFGAWEGFLFAKYGESHFLHHLHEQSAESGNWLVAKSALIPGLVGHLGCLGFGIALSAAGALGLSNRTRILAATMWVVGVGLVCVLPSEVLRVRNVWRVFGSGSLLASGLVLLLLVRRRTGLRMSHDSWFVAGWLLLELAGYFILTPFPAGRRVIGFTIVFGLAAARLIRLRRSPPPQWVLTFAIVSSLLFTALDTYDACPEKLLAERAAERLRGETKVWYSGHWGWQFYCNRAGFTMVIPGQTVIQPGEVLVIPSAGTDREAFQRPHIGLIRIEPPARSFEVLEHHSWHDALAGQTVPNFYGGNDPIENQVGSRPRLTVTILRFTKPWAVPGR